jgi:hypothetical protein
MKNAARQHQASGDHQPEAEVVHAREGHVGRANLQRDHPVREAHEGRHDRAEHHDQAVHGGELVEQLGVDDLQAGLEQLGTDQQRQQTAEHQHGRSENSRYSVPMSLWLVAKTQRRQPWGRGRGDRRGRGP